ncbi:UNVERIFIED_CONTAM: hypothetical protein GTU68_010582 [Idotea baltica]|nr:hypothetical protein [Idotea baltica]
MSDSPILRLRVDKWLWAARFFKTRSIATDAISKNRVRVDGQRIKPSRSVQIGDTVQIEKTPYVFDVTVLGLNDKRRPASEATLLYEESEESIAKREAQSSLARLDYQAQAGIAGEGRPSKKQRRQIIRFQNQHDQAPMDDVHDVDSSTGDD